MGGLPIDVLFRLGVQSINGLSNAVALTLTGRELGHPPVPVGTTVHDPQVVACMPRDPTDQPLSVIATPTRAIRIKHPSAAPTGIDWTRLSVEDLEEMPILAELKRMTTSNAQTHDIIVAGLRTDRGRRPFEEPPLTAESGGATTATLRDLHMSAPSSNRGHISGKNGVVGAGDCFGVCCWLFCRRP